ncbi:RmuC family protein [Thalassotalea insulae]|uniref:RmuC family protein n=1 Tax=Thalassotalea insulae TaxID=2056778 RepID=A0ABQ6GN50_9GAMM|nr:DNA recombination protein RmuC [Thalassotalea insulae]GLX77306.1 RmuC family protein [Thalassotalea insulae]
MKSLIESLLVSFDLSPLELVLCITMLLTILLSIGFGILFFQLKRINNNTNAGDNHALQLINKLELMQALLSKEHQQLQHSITQNHQQSSLAANELKHGIDQQLADSKIKLLRQQSELAEKQLTVQHQHQQQFNQTQSKAVDQLVEHLNKASAMNRDEQRKSLQASSEQIAEKMKELTAATDNKLKEISEQVEKRLADGFDKTTKTFNDILKRLALIDDAQKKITELSTNVVSLQEVLADKRSRGAFGEVQLNSLIRNVLPEQHFSLQHTLSNGKIADCVLFLPEPTGTVVIDAKFPLESYRKMTDINVVELERKAAERQFKADIKKHIKDISEKYLIEKETADGAIMFLPAEAIFAEIHGHYPELVEFANKQRVWLTSPTTLMAILTTARAVIKDEATREQVHIIQAHLAELSADFGRFRTRFNNLAKHIDQAAGDVKQIHTSADKIATRFSKIEQVELHKAEVEEIENASLSVTK